MYISSEDPAKHTHTWIAVYTSCLRAATALPTVKAHDCCLGNRQDSSYSLVAGLVRHSKPTVQIFATPTNAKQHVAWRINVVPVLEHTHKVGRVLPPTCSMWHLPTTPAPAAAQLVPTKAHSIDWDQPWASRQCTHLPACTQRSDPTTWGAAPQLCNHRPCPPQQPVAPPPPPPTPPQLHSTRAPRGQASTREAYPWACTGGMHATVSRSSVGTPNSSANSLRQRWDTARVGTGVTQGSNPNTLTMRQCQGVGQRHALR